MNLLTITENLDNLFEVKKLAVDPSMGKWVPRAYAAIGFDWKATFESDFCRRFNGLMLKGAENVSRIFCSVFPTDEVFRKFLTNSNKGDLLFLHHPIDLRCGDPRDLQNLGAGFTPISPKILEEIHLKGLSIYTCHAPMDCGKEIGTNAAIVKALDAIVTGEFLPYGNGFAGRICEISPLSTKQLTTKLLTIFQIPYVDFAGKEMEKISKIAIVAGGGDDVEAMAEAESKGVQAYLTGEIHSYHSSNWAKQNTVKVNEFAGKTNMSMIGVSHAASEYRVIKDQMISWFESTFNIKSVGIPESKWWR